MFLGVRGTSNTVAGEALVVQGNHQFCSSRVLVTPGGCTQSQFTAKVIEREVVQAAFPFR